MLPEATTHENTLKRELRKAFNYWVKGYKRPVFFFTFVNIRGDFFKLNYNRDILVYTCSGGVPAAHSLILRTDCQYSISVFFI